MHGKSVSVLVGSFFSRSHLLEGTGTLLSGLTDGMLEMGWKVRLLLPHGSENFHPAVEVHTCKSGLFGGICSYQKSIATLSADVDCALFIENNPNMLSAANSSKCDKTYCMFCTPLLGLNVFAELGVCKQAFLHFLLKNHLVSRIKPLKQRHCFVASEYQANQLRKMGARHVYPLPVAGVSRKAIFPERHEAREEFSLPDVQIVGYLGHFSRAKGVDTLVEAFEAYTGPAKLAIAYSGKGKLKRRAASTLDRLARQGRAKMFGIVEPGRFLAACDVIALPYPTSSVYHQPQVMLESFAAGTAVITTDIGGFSEMIGPYHTGILTPPRDVSALTDAIKDAVSDLPRIHRMGCLAKEVFKKTVCREVFLNTLDTMISE